ncbi:DUF4219 domain-containing protein, partial [Cephalotus follicularis]
KRRIL